MSTDEQQIAQVEPSGGAVFDAAGRRWVRSHGRPAWYSVETRQELPWADLVAEHGPVSTPCVMARHEAVECGRVATVEEIVAPDSPWPTVVLWCPDCAVLSVRAAINDGQTIKLQPIGGPVPLEESKS